MEGTVRNDTPRAQRVTITLTALDGEGRALCFTGIKCTTDVELVVPAGGRADFGELLFIGDCRRVARLEITHLEAEPVG